MRKWLLSVFVVYLPLSAAQAQFCPGAPGWVFDDVLASDPFCGFITWVAENGVSLGCQTIDAGHRLYCPNANVSRGQMAAFVSRSFDMPDSKSLEVGTITKPGGAFLHNFGDDNVFLGVGAGNFAMTGNANTAIGRRALASNTFGPHNVAVGTYSLYVNTWGAHNTAVGSATLMANTQGDYNTALGAFALANNDVGSWNTAVGQNALAANTQGMSNVAIGRNALLYPHGAVQTVAVGTEAAIGATGSKNIAIGDSAGWYWQDGSSNIAIGSMGAAGDSTTIRLGNAIHSNTFIAGIRGTATSLNDAVNVVIDGNGQLGTISSSRDAKDNIADMSDASAALMQLRPVTFHYKGDHDPAGPRLQYGLIAEEVAHVYPGMVATKDGKPETVMYQYLAPMLLNEYQKQQRTIDAQAREIAELKRAVEVLVTRTLSDSRMAAR
jgi:hypothetical protein